MKPSSSSPTFTAVTFDSPLDVAFPTVHPFAKDGVSFKAAVRADKASTDSIDEWVGYWHASTLSCSLSGFLGFTDAEYALWVRDASALLGIVNS